MRIILSLLLISFLSFGAVNTGTVGQVWTTGSAGNGGGFSVDATGFLTDGQATSATGTGPTFHSDSYTFVSGDIGAWVFIKSGTNWIPGWYEITSISSGDAVLIATIGTGTLYPSYTVSTVAGVATTGSPTGATWGIDFSHQTGAEISFTDIIVGGGGDVEGTSVLNPISVRMIGNVFNVTAGSGCTVQHVTLQSVSGVTGTFSTDLGTAASSCTAAMGGAKVAMTDWVTPGVAGLTVFVKATASYGPLGATQTFSVTGTAGNPVTYIGYTTTPGDDGMVTITTSTNNVVMVNVSGALHRFRNFIAQRTGGTTVKGFVTAGNNTVFRRCKALDTTSNGFEFSGAANFKCFNCWAQGVTGGNGFAITATANSYGVLYGCVALSCSVTGISFQNTDTEPSACIMCISANNTGSANGFGNSGSAGVSLDRVVGYGNAGSGYNISNTSANFSVTNSVFYNNTGSGVTSSTNFTVSGVNQVLMDYNAFGDNDAGDRSQVPIGPHDVTLTADPFTSSTDFSLNNTAGGGALLRSTGFPGALLAGGTGYNSIGPLEPQPAAGGGGQKGYILIGRSGKRIFVDKDLYDELHPRTDLAAIYWPLPANETIGGIMMIGALVAFKLRRRD